MWTDIGPGTGVPLPEKGHSTPPLPIETGWGCPHPVREWTMDQELTSGWKYPGMEIGYPPPCEKTDACENSTFPVPFGMRAVITGWKTLRVNTPLNFPQLLAPTYRWKCHEKLRETWLPTVLVWDGTCDWNLYSNQLLKRLSGWPHSSWDKIPCVFLVLWTFSLCFFHKINRWVWVIKDLTGL